MIKCDVEAYVIKGTFTIDGLPGEFKEATLQSAIINKKGELVHLKRL